MNKKKKVRRAKKVKRRKIKRPKKQKSAPENKMMKNNIKNKSRTWVHDPVRPE